MLQLRMPALDIPDDWQPTPEAVNALPEPLRRYVANLETVADPASLVREATVQRETALALAERVRQLEQPPQVDGERALVRQRHRAAAVRALLPATTESSWVWTDYVVKGDSSSKQLRDVVRVAQLVADAEAGLLLPPEERPAPPKPVPSTAQGMTTSAFMGEKK
jgi:hypothetical protein